MNDNNDLNNRVTKLEQDQARLSSNMYACGISDYNTSRISALTAQVSSTKYVTEQYEKQSDVTQKLLKELIAEIKDLKEEGAQQEREIEQIRDEFEKFKEEVRELLKENTEANMGAIATGLWSSWKSGSNGYFGYSPVDSIKFDPIGDADIGGSSVSLKKLRMERQVTGDSNGHTVVVDTYTDDELSEA